MLGTDGSVAALLVMGAEVAAEALDDPTAGLLDADGAEGEVVPGPIAVLAAALGSVTTGCSFDSSPFDAAQPKANKNPPPALQGERTSRRL